MVGTEVKVVRNGEASLTGSYAQVKDGQLFLNQVRIPPYAFGNRFNHDSLRTRRLLVHKSEVRNAGDDRTKGFRCRLYLSPKGLVKVELGICRARPARTNAKRLNAARRFDAACDFAAVQRLSLRRLRL